MSHANATPEEARRHLAEWLQPIPDAVICAAIRSGTDLASLLADQLAQRGINHDGKWVGFNHR